jgi:hypothetical protein
MRRFLVIAASIICAGCHSTMDDQARARIARLEQRVTALEQASKPAAADAGHKFELVIPGTGDERRFYGSESECMDARQRFLDDAANRQAAVQANFPGRPLYTVPPAISCIPA